MGDDENVVHEEVWEKTCKGIGGFLQLVDGWRWLGLWAAPLVRGYSTHDCLNTITVWQLGRHSEARQPGTSRDLRGRHCDTADITNHESSSADRVTGIQKEWKQRVVQLRLMTLPLFGMRDV